MYQRKHDFKITYSAREFFNKDMNNTFHLAAIGDLRWSMHQSLRRAILQMMEFYKNKIFKYKKKKKNKKTHRSLTLLKPIVLYVQIMHKNGAVYPGVDIYKITVFFPIGDYWDG